MEDCTQQKNLAWIIVEGCVVPMPIFQKLNNFKGSDFDTVNSD